MNGEQVKMAKARINDRFAEGLAEACVQSDYGTAYDADVPTHASVKVRIDGLKQIGTDTFELAGCRIREIDWEGVAKAIGRKILPDALAAEIDNAVWRYDVAEILADRMTRDVGEDRG